MTAHCFAISKHELVRERACHFGNEPRNPLRSITFKFLVKSGITNLKTPYLPFVVMLLLLFGFVCRVPSVASLDAIDQAWNAVFVPTAFCRLIPVGDCGVIL